MSPRAAVVATTVNRNGHIILAITVTIDLVELAIMLYNYIREVLGSSLCPGATD